MSFQLAYPREKSKKAKFNSHRRNKWCRAIAACHSLNLRSIEKKRPIAYGNNFDWHVSRVCYSRHCRSILLLQFRPSRVPRRNDSQARESFRSCWFWQTNLSRNNDGSAVLDGDDETNGMCPIIGSGRNVHIVGLSTLNTLKHPTMFEPLFPFRSFRCILNPPFAYSSVCAYLFIRPRI